MSDIKLVLYKENRAPRSIALTTGMIYRTLFLAALSGALLIFSVALSARFYMLSRAKTSQTTQPTTSPSDDEFGPSNSTEEQNRSLRDQIDQLKTRLQNSAATQSGSKEIDKRNAALALFSPIVVDLSKDQNLVTISNFKYSKGNPKVPSTLTFELHNAHPGASTEKGYIVILARAENSLQAYPNIFNKTGPFLLDFEKGETFQVARFRLVNAQFDVATQHFQILIFTRKGELLINTLYEVKNDGA